MEVGRAWALHPLLALFVLAPFTGEVLSSNVPASLFVLRPTLIAFAVVTYSVPVLLIRELWVARTLSPSALLVCGLAYGIFNEGILARTLLLRAGLPVPIFDGYLVAWGVTWSWGITILVWHAIFSVATPIIVVHTLWPEAARVRWLTKGWSIAALAVTFVTSLLYFRSEGAPAPPPIYFLAFVFGIGVLLAMAARWKERVHEHARPSWTPLLAGALFFAFFAGLFVIAGRRLPSAVFLGYALAVLVAFASQRRRLARARGGFLLFCIGNCATYSLFVFVAKTRASAEGIVVMAAVACGCLFMVRRALGWPRSCRPG